MSPLGRRDMKVTFVVVDSSGLVPYIEGLRALEASISYPIDDGRDFFRIDHGSTYHPFFSQMGKARFLVALQGGEVVGGLVVVWRTVEVGGKRYTGLYLCDLKVAKAWRGTGLVRRMLWHVLVRWPLRKDFQGWSFVYFAAMRGESGDVAKSFRGWHLGKVVRPISRLSLYFVQLGQLCRLPVNGPPAPCTPGLNFSPDNHATWQVTLGRKDFQLRSTGCPWSLVHFPRAVQHHASWGHYLKETAMQLNVDTTDALACFSVDDNLLDQKKWLADQGLERGASCFIYGFSIPFVGPRLGGWAWAHLATSEI